MQQSHRVMCATLDVKRGKEYIGENWRGSDTNSQAIQDFKKKIGDLGSGHIIANMLGFTGRETWSLKIITCIYSLFISLDPTVLDLDCASSSNVSWTLQILQNLQ